MRGEWQTASRDEEVRPGLLDILCCPRCRAALVEAGADGGSHEAELVCAHRHRYPVIRGIPRLLPDQQKEAGEFGKLQADTRLSFGYQWTAFHDMVEAFREDFLAYAHPVGPEFFPGKRGLDAGCGFGRHAYYAATFGAEVVGVDFLVRPAGRPPAALLQPGGSPGLGGARAVGGCPRDANGQVRLAPHRPPAVMRRGRRTRGGSRVGDYGLRAARARRACAG